MYADFGAQLPGPTRFLVGLSDGMRKGGPIVAPLIFAYVLGE
jgi:type II secretory pathway component PulF